MSWLQTRESSTLVIVTFLASASLLLVTVSHNTVSSLCNVALVGFVFAFAGLVYRQLTVWSIDRIEHNRDPNRHVIRNRTHEYYTYALTREFVVLLFICIPVALWGLLVVWSRVPTLAHSCESIGNNVWSITDITTLSSVIIASSLTLIDWIIRWYDKHNNS
jgi:hypothetical protein